MSNTATRYTSTRSARIARQDRAQAERALRMFAYVPAPAASTHAAAERGHYVPREVTRYWTQQSVWREAHAGAVAWSGGKAIYPGLVFVKNRKTHAIYAIGL